MVKTKRAVKTENTSPQPKTLEVDQGFNVFSNEETIYVRLLDSDLASKISQLFSAQYGTECGIHRDILILRRNAPQGRARLELGGQPAELAENLLNLFIRSELWHPIRMDPIQVQDGLNVVIDRLANLPTLSEGEKAGLRAVIELCEKSLRGESDNPLPPKKSRVTNVLLQNIGLLEPQEFFDWFDGQLPHRGRGELQAVIRHWVKLQSGRHEFAELSPDLAVSEKHKIARGLQVRLDQIGLSILCQHIGRAREETCGRVGRLNAELTGDSKTGQYFVKHNSSTGGKASHMRNTLFPSLILCNSPVDGGQEISTCQTIKKESRKIT